MINSKTPLKNLHRPAPDTSKRIKHYRFDRNERTTLFKNSDFEKMLSTLSPYDFVAYGELEPFYLKLTKFLEIDRKNILLASGSDTAIKSVFETFIEKGDEVLTSLPNYAMFSVYCEMFGANEKKFLHGEDLKLDINQFKKKITPKTKLVILSNPSHTGGMVKTNELIGLIKKCKRNNALLLLDEAYYQFSSISNISLIKKFSNLLIIQTFSKAFGLASLRIGMLIANKTLISELYKVKLVHEISGVAAKIGMYLIDNNKIVRDYVKSVIKGKNILYKELENIGCSVYRSDANFVFFKLPLGFKSINFINGLKKENIYIKGPFNNYPFEDHLRVTVGDEEQMLFFIEHIKKNIDKNEA